MQNIKLILLSLIFVATTAESSIMIPLSKKSPIKSHHDIRVKIFPHSKNYRPHGKDINKTSLTLASTGLCNIYVGSVTDR